MSRTVSPSRPPSFGQHRCIAAAAAATLALAVPAASADVIERYATNVATNSAWTNESFAEGNPGNLDCNGVPEDYSTCECGSTVLWADAFGSAPFAIPSGHRITRVQAEALCRYDDGTNAYVNAHIRIAGVDITLPGPSSWTSGPDNCSWRMGTQCDLTTLRDWNANPGLLSQIDVGVSRQSSVSCTRTLRVKAFRITVTTTCDLAPPTSASVSPIVYCSDSIPSSITLHADGGTGGSNGILQWFTGGCAATHIGSGNDFIVSPAPTVTTTYWVRWNNACGGTSCIPVAVTVVPNPPAPTDPAASPATVSPGQNSCLSAVAPPNAVLEWFVGSCGGAAVPPPHCVSPQQTTTYYVRSRLNSADGCVSPCVPVVVTVVPPDVGACCRSDCSCTSTSEPDCQGQWFARTACGVPPCAPCGACCLDVGVCASRTQVACPGPWFGGAACTPTSCPLCNSPGGPQSPANNLCVNALPLTINIPRSVTTVCASGLVNPNCGSANDVWCSFEAPYTDRFVFSLFGIAGNGAIALVPDCSEQPVIACNQSCIGGVPSLVTHLLFQGQTVKVRIANCTPAYNNFTVVVQSTGPIGACCRSTGCDISTQQACTGRNTRFVGPSTTCNGPGNDRIPCCRCDFNQNGILTVQDIFDFLACWFNGSFLPDCNGDFNGSGNVSVQDLFDFLACYFSGCS